MIMTLHNVNRVNFGLIVFLALIGIITLIGCTMPSHSRGTHYYTKEPEMVGSDLTKINVFRLASFFKNPSGSLWCILDDNYSDDPKSIIALRVKSMSRPNKLLVYGTNVKIFYPDPALKKDQFIYKTSIFARPQLKIYTGSHILIPVSDIHNPPYEALRELLGDEREKIVTYPEYLFGPKGKDMKVDWGDGNPIYIFLKKADIIGELGKKDEISWYKKAGEGRLILFEFYGTGVSYFESELSSFLPNHLYEYDLGNSGAGFEFKIKAVNKY